MKLIRNGCLFFLFFLLFVFRGSVDAFLISYLKEPAFDSSLEVSYKNLLEEHEMLEHTLKIHDMNYETPIYSKLIYRNPFAFYESLFILKGEEEGILKNAAVLNEKGLIGTIESVENHKSEVRLLTSLESVISVKVRDVYGIMKTNPFHECWIENLSYHVPLEKEDPIWTSGLTEVPGNILVGVVEEIQKDELGLIQRVKVKLAADFNNIHYVTVLLKGEL